MDGSTMPRPDLAVTQQEMIDAYGEALKGSEYQVLLLTTWQQKAVAALADRERTIAGHVATIAQRDERITELETELASLKESADAFLGKSTESPVVVEPE